MRKIEILGLAAAVMAGAIASPALADVSVTATITKTKDISVTETITVNKVIAIDVNVAMLNATRAAEALALANVSNHNNLVDRTVTTKVLNNNTPVDPSVLVADDGTITRLASMTGSTNGNHGAVGVNQDTGNDVNQGNLVAFAFTQNGQAFTNSQASVSQSNQSNDVEWGPFTLGTTTNSDPISITADIDGSISNNTGIVGVNQNSGNFNNQTNAVALAAGVAVQAPGPGGTFAGVALAEADLGQLNTGNTVNEVNTTSTATISNSIIGNTGIVGVNQATGNNSNQANTVSVAATLQ